MNWVIVVVIGAISAGLFSGCTPVGIAIVGAAAAGVVIAGELSRSDAIECEGIKLGISDKSLEESRRLCSEVYTPVV